MLVVQMVVIGVLHNICFLLLISWIIISQLTNTNVKMLRQLSFKRGGGWVVVSTGLDSPCKIWVFYYLSVAINAKL